MEGQPYYQTQYLQGGRPVSRVSQGKRAIELVLLFCIVLANVVEFLGFLPGDLDVLDKVLAWIALAYLFIDTSLTTILVGYRKYKVDVIIVIAYLMFIVKDFTSFVQVGVEEVSLFRELFEFISKNISLFDRYSFYIGALLLVFISLYLALRAEVRQPSFMAVLHEVGPPAQSIMQFMVRFISFLLVLVAFYIAIFNLAAEWLAVALDADLVIIGIFVYFFIIVRYHKHLGPSNLLYKLGSLGEGFYQRFIQMFHYKQTLYLGITGLLALHLLADLGHFIVPYILGFRDAMYFTQLGEGHTPLFTLFMADAAGKAASESIAILVVYLLNAAAMAFLLILPAFVWYRFFKGRTVLVSRTSLALVFSSLMTFALSPAFMIKKISVEGLAGVDIVTKSVVASPSLIDKFFPDKASGLIVLAIFSIFLGIVLWLLEYSQRIEKDVFIFAVVIGLVYFGVYIFNYFVSIMSYYLSMVSLLMQHSEYLIASFLMLFALTSAVFYIGGYLFFIFEVGKRHFFSSLR